MLHVLFPVTLLTWMNVKAILAIGAGLEVVLVFGVVFIVNFTRGIIRVAFIVLAILLGLLVAWNVLVGTVPHGPGGPSIGAPVTGP